MGILHALRVLGKAEEVLYGIGAQVEAEAPQDEPEKWGGMRKAGCLKTEKCPSQWEEMSNRKRWFWRIVSMIPFFLLVWGVVSATDWIMALLTEKADAAGKRVFYLNDGRRLGYLLCGDPKGKPVLCFHGYPGSRLDFRWLHEEAAKRGLKLIAADRPGIGLSDPLPDRSLTDFGGDMEELMARLRLKRPVVMGVSGGGPYALACLCRLQEKVRAGVVVCGLGPMDTEESTQGMNASNASLFYCARNYPEIRWAYF